MQSKGQIIHNTANQELVIALHCSGGNARQWRALSEVLEADYLLETPSHIDNVAAVTGPGNGRLTLDDEAVQSVQLIDKFAGKVHLVGHSYGGAVALKAALARPDRIASIALYEPCIFHILPQLGSIVLSETTEIHGVAESIERHIAANDHRSAMREFVNYWGGPEAWQSLREEHQRRLMAWAPIAALEFNALFRDETPLQTYWNLQIPVNLMLGDCSPAPVKAISDALLNLFPECRFERLPGLGHMGPLTHADQIAQLLGAHIASNSSITLPGKNESPSRRSSGSVPAMAEAA